jgi:hypothetical protein
MITNTDILEIQNITKSYKTNEDLHQKLKMYFLQNIKSYKNVDPSRLAWAVYCQLIRNNFLK